MSPPFYWFPQSGYNAVIVKPSEQKSERGGSDENGAISAGRACTPSGGGYLGGGGWGGNEPFLCTGPLDPLVNPLGAREFPGG